MHSNFHPIIAAAAVLIVGAIPGAAEPLQPLLDRTILEPGETGDEAALFVERRVAPLPAFTDSSRSLLSSLTTGPRILENVVFRGAAAEWRTLPPKVTWLETIPGGPGYHIRKLRYESAPGLWIPAILYEPDSLSDRTPVVLDVNGHEPAGKAADYEQLRDINLVKRGLLVLHPEWLGMGQLRGTGYDHGRMNQLDLCGTSGLAVFFLAMQRGLDVLLTLPQADPQRVAVSGLSGGGWQTILLSALDPRVTLANPVAGYSSLVTRARHHKDLGDSEQMPADLGLYADYTHLTALRAPRPTLLTYNAKDDCCFESGYALPPLTAAAERVFQILGQPQNLRVHINENPGTHNFLVENREAFYAMLRDHGFGVAADFPVREIPSEAELKTPEQLLVAMPSNNATFNSLAREQAAKLEPGRNQGSDSPNPDWQNRHRDLLRNLVRATNYLVSARKLGTSQAGDTAATFWRLEMGHEWTVPIVELVRGQPNGTVILVADAGRRSLAASSERYLAAGKRVLAVDSCLVGESRVNAGGYLYSLLIDCVGARPLGIQASQLAAVARWGTETFHDRPALVAVGPRMSVAGLVAAGLEVEAVSAVETIDAKPIADLIREDHSIGDYPELFCFGLLTKFDLPELQRLVQPRPLKVPPGP